MFEFIRENHRFCVLSPAISRVDVPSFSPSFSDERHLVGGNDQAGSSN